MLNHFSKSSYKSIFCFFCYFLELAQSLLESVLKSSFRISVSIFLQWFQTQHWLKYFGGLLLVSIFFFSDFPLWEYTIASFKWRILSQTTKIGSGKNKKSWWHVLSLITFHQILVLSWAIRYSVFQKVKSTSSLEFVCDNPFSTFWHLMVKFG